MLQILNHLECIIQSKTSLKHQKDNLWSQIKNQVQLKHIRIENNLLNLVLQAEKGCLIIILVGDPYLQE